MLKTCIAVLLMLLLVTGPITILVRQPQIGLLKLMLVDEMSDPLNAQEDYKTKWSEDWVAGPLFTQHLLPLFITKHNSFECSSFPEEIFLEVNTPPPLV